MSTAIQAISRFCSLQPASKGYWPDCRNNNSLASCSRLDTGCRSTVSFRGWELIWLLLGLGWFWPSGCLLGPTVDNFSWWHNWTCNFSILVLLMQIGCSYKALSIWWSLWWAGDSGNSFACPQYRGISPGELSSCCTSEPSSSSLECKEHFSSTHWPSCPRWTGWVPTQITFSVPRGGISPVFAVSQTRCYQWLLSSPFCYQNLPWDYQLTESGAFFIAMLLIFFLIYLSWFCPFVETNPSKSVQCFT